ncbi:uroporphyrinogen-III synthase [Paraflavitalea pollutisoli]|uniref:uroporphyrinogen-III synthase n=1 Tax=Paraflavitalea pollutisoli TaxID=3034143 RepID=UPI0023EBA12F|nr:uroporphyrinogen-III synthase [Paraflavitalea sp. H1-2-19X]
MASQHTILSTKKLEPGIRNQLEANGIHLVEQPFIDVQPIVNYSKYKEIWPVLNVKADQAIVFTSKHAVEAIGKHLSGGDAVYIPDNWEIFCLDGATKDKVTEVFSALHIVATAPNATELAAKIIAYGDFKEVVFFCGNQRLDTVPDALKAGGIGVKEIVVYNTTDTPSPIETNSFSAVLFFSPSGVKSFFSVNSLPPAAVCIAIGATTAGILSNYITNRIIISAVATQLSMAESVTDYLQQIDSYK